MFDTAGERELTLKAARDVRLDLLRWHAVIKSGDHNHRHIDGWKPIDGHANQCCPAKHGDNQSDDDDEVRSLNGKSRHRSNASLRSRLSVRQLWTNLLA